MMGGSDSISCPLLFQLSPSPLRQPSHQENETKTSDTSRWVGQTASRQNGLDVSENDPKIKFLANQLNRLNKNQPLNNCQLIESQSKVSRECCGRSLIA